MKKYNMLVQGGYMLHTRRERIQKAIRIQGSVKVKDLISEFTVSGETIRKDLEFLEQEGCLVRVHGGAVACEKTPDEPNYLIRKDTNAASKSLIAKIVISLVPDGVSIILDHGTTTLEIAKLLRGKRDITVITNSVMAAMNLVDIPSITVHLLGGTLTPGEHSTIGILAEQNLKLFNADILITSVGGISPTHGITDYHTSSLGLRKILFSSARKVIVAADHSKLDTVALNNVCPINGIDYLVTDGTLSDETLRQYQALGVQVLFVSREENAE